MYDSIEIGKKINQRRKDLNLTLKEVATKVGVASSTISRYENGDIDHVKLPVLESIAKVLSIDIAWLIGKTNTCIEEPIYNPYDYIKSNFGNDCVKLLKAFLNLNTIGQKKVLEYAKDLNVSNHYTLKKEEQHA